MRLLPWLVLVTVAVGFVDAPFFHPGLPLGDDTEIHLYRLVDLDQLLRQGIIFSRWQPDLVYGYGSPIFSFYAPLSAYLALVGHLAGLSLRSGLKVEFAALPIVAGLATFAFLRRRLAAGPSLVGAIAYLSSLYFLYNIFVRGSISDSLAMALFPVLLLALDSLVDRPGPARAALFALTAAAVFLSHNISGPMIVPLLALFAVVRSRENARALIWPVLGLALGICLALFFLGPALLMVGDTRVPEFLAAPGMHYDLHFLSPATLFGLTATAYPGAMLTELPIRLGLIQMVIGLGSLLGLSRVSVRVRGEIVALALTLIVSASLTLPFSAMVWEKLPVLQAIQYPWRFLAVAAFADALLIGYTAEELLVTGIRRVEVYGSGAVALIVLLLGIPFLYPLPGDILPSNPGLADVTAYQQRSGALGATSNSEFLPRGLTTFPPGPPFSGADTNATLARKLDSASLPPGANVTALQDSPLATRLNVASPTAFIAHFQVFRFPGWLATIDDRPVELGDPGMYQTLTVPVPAGQHVLAVAFRETRGQVVFDWVSALAAIVVVGLIVAEFLARPVLASLVERRRWATGQLFRPNQLPRASTTGPRQFSAQADPAIVAILLVALLVVALKWSIFDRVATPLVRPFNGHSPPGMVTFASHRFGSGLQLLGYSWDHRPVHPGEVATITLYWSTSVPLSVNYSSFVHVVDAASRGVAQQDNVHVADFPTSRWRIGAYARDVHALQFSSTVAAGTYNVQVGIYDRGTGQQLRVDDTPADVLSLTPVSVLAAESGSR